MSIFHETCPACGYKSEVPVEWTFHMRADHGRDDEPCERCGEWDDERTTNGPGGWLHERCADQLATEEALRHYERLFEDGAA